MDSFEDDSPLFDPTTQCACGFQEHEKCPSFFIAQKSKGHYNGHLTNYGEIHGQSRRRVA
jgi:hypothetical protein